MQFTVPATVFMAFVSGALAQVAGFDTLYEPEKGQVIPAGESYTIVWEAGPAKYDDETIAIYLLSGKDPLSLELDEEPIATGVVNSDGQYDWDVPATLGDKPTYGLQIQLESDKEVFQLSFPFKIDGSGGSYPSGSGSEPSATPSSDHTSSAIEEPTGEPEPEEPEKPEEPEEPEEPSTDEPEPEQPPESAAVANGAMGAVALAGALAAAVLTF